MTDKAHYIIQKQIFDIRHGKHVNAYAIQTEISSRYKNEVVPLLEKVCRELCPDDRLIKIDTLIVELPSMNERSYTANWAQEVEKIFRQNLSQAIIQGPEPQNKNVIILSQNDADLQLLASFLYTGILPWSYTESPDRSLEVVFRALIRKETVAVRRLLTEGLKQKHFTKRLSYQFRVPLIIELLILLQPAHAADIRNSYKFLHHCLEKTDGFKNKSDTVFLLNYYSLWQLAKQPYYDEKRFIAQVLQHISDAWKIPYRELVNSLLQNIKPAETKDWMASFITCLGLLNKEATSISEAQKVTHKLPKLPGKQDRTEKATTADRFQWELQQLLREAEHMKYVLEEEKEMFYEAVKKRLKQLLLLVENNKPEAAKSSEPLKERLKQFLREPEPGSEASGKGYDHFKTALKELLNDFPLQKENGWDIPEQRHKEWRQEEATAFLENMESPIVSPVSKSNTLPEEIYLQNAGLVIVWPFFKQLFEELKFTEKHRFISKEKQLRAVHLLQYLVSEEENCNEYHLGLNKLLCGLELSEPVPQQLVLLQEEKENAKDLIKSAIVHWPVMKNTSVEGFREAFLMREGKLSRNNNRWLLRVAQKSYDMIMDKLPWTISLVKLPWMPEALYVEW